MENYNYEFAEQFRNRTKKFVIQVIDLYRQLPKTSKAQIIGNQWLRC